MSGSCEVFVGRVEYASLIGHAGEVDFENCARPGFAVGPDKSAILFHDSIHRRQPQPCALARGLGGVEGFEDVRQMIGGNADAVVAHGHHNVVARRNERRFLLNVRLGEFDRGGFDGDTATLGHGIPGIGGQVHQDLLDLDRVDADAAEPLPGDEVEFDVFANQAVQRPSDVGDDGIQVDDAKCLYLFAAEGEQLPGQLRGSAGGGEYFLKLVLDRASRNDRIQGQFGIAGDDGEQVVEIVGDSARETADGIHFLSLQQLCFQAEPIRKVATVGDKVSNTAGGIAHGTDALFEVVKLSALFPVDEYTAIHIAGEDGVPQVAVGLRNLLARLENLGRLSRDFPARVSTQSFKRGIHVLDQTLAIGDHDGVGRLLDRA